MQEMEKGKQSYQYIIQCYSYTTGGFKTEEKNAACVQT